MVRERGAEGDFSVNGEQGRGRGLWENEVLFCSFVSPVKQ